VEITTELLDIILELLLELSVIELLNGIIKLLDELGSWQLETICAAPALTSSIQEESDISEQEPAAN
jgi:hypothetical protein